MVYYHCNQKLISKGDTNMNELRNARKEELSLQYHQLNAQAKKEVFEFLNSPP